MVPDNHALREFFHVLVEKHYSEEAGLHDQEVGGNGLSSPRGALDVSPAGSGNALSSP